MPNLDPAALIAEGPSTGSDISDKMPVEIPAPSPEGDKTINFDIFDQIKSGNKLTKEELSKELFNTEEPKKEVDPKIVAEVEKLKVEEEASAKALAEKEAAAKRAEEANIPKPPLTARQPKVTPPQEVDDSTWKEVIPESAIPLLKKASKETQEFVIAEFKRNKTALEAAKAEAEVAKKSVREGLPTSWYEHENAYSLTPEFQAAQQKAETLKSYSNHFRQQLIQIEDGEKWVDLTIGADGKVQQVVKEPGSHAKVAVMERLQNFENAVRQEQQQAHNIAINFRQQVTNLRGDMKKAEDEYFPQYKTDFEKNEHGNYVMKVMQTKGQGQNPIAPFLAKLYATYVDTYEDLEKLQGEMNKGKKIAAVNNGPTGEEINKGEVPDNTAKTGDDAPFDPVKFEEVMNRMR